MDDLDAALSMSAAFIGHNGRMPARRETPDMPERAAAVHHAVSGTSRLVTLRWLLEHAGSTRSELVDGAGLTSSAARFALRELEELGYVKTDIEGARKGRVIRYTVARPVLTDDLTAFVAWLIR